MKNKEEKLYGVVVSHLPDPSNPKSNHPNWHVDGPLLFEQPLGRSSLEEAEERARGLSRYGHAIVVELKFTQTEYLRGNPIVKNLPF